MHELVCDFMDNRSTINFLLERGADSTVHDVHGRTVLESLPCYNLYLATLFRPAEQKRTEMLGESDLNIIDEHGNTLLHNIILRHKSAKIEPLINHYLLPTTSNKRGKTVLDLLYKLQDQACIDALHKAVFTIFFCTPCYKHGYKEMKAFFKHAFASSHREIFVRGIVHQAAQLSRESAYKFCTYLLKWGAPVNVQSQVGDFPQHDDKHPYALSWAIEIENRDLIKLFLCHKAIVHGDMLILVNKISSHKIYEMLEKHYQKQKER